MAKPSISLALSSGGARGMAHIGVIEGLLAHGFEISSVSGSSIGSIVGGLYASGQLEPYRDWMLNLDKMDVFRLFDFTVSRMGLMKGEKVFAEMAKIVHDVPIETLPIPFSAVAVDLERREEVAFRKGSLLRAMRASVAIPGVLQPGQVDGVLYVDGGVMNPLPMEGLARHKNEILVAVDLNAGIPYTPENPNGALNSHPDSAYALLMSNFKDKLQIKFGSKKEANRRIGYFTMLIQTFEIMQQKITRTAIEKHKPDLLISISRDACSTLEFYRTAEMIAYGRRELEAALARASTQGLIT